MEGQRFKADDFSDDQTLYVDAFALTGKSVAVGTTNKTILDCLNSLENDSKEELREIYRSIYKAIIDFDDDKVVERIRKGDVKAKKEWQNFCDDVVLGYCVRLMLHQKEIPVFLEKGDALDVHALL